MTLGTWAILSLAVLVAAFVQGSSGLGFALITTPVIGLTDPGLVPVTTLLLMIPLNAYVAWRERGHIDRHGARWICLGRVPGTVPGLVLLAIIPLAHINLLVGVATVLAAVATLMAPAFSPKRGAFVAAGTITGVVETATGVGGPPYALVYQHHSAPVMRATVAFCFLVGELASLLVIAATGRMHSDQLTAALWLAPALVVGSVVSNLVHGKVRGPRVRIGIIAFSIVSGVTLLLKA